MKPRYLLLAVLVVALAGCGRKESSPEEDPAETNMPPTSVTSGRPGPGHIGGGESGPPPPATADTPPSRDDQEPAAPSPVAERQTTAVATNGTPVETGTGYFLSYQATHPAPSPIDTYHFRPADGDIATGRFSRDFRLFSCEAWVPKTRTPKDTRKLTFSITGWQDGQSAYVYPWRSYHPRYFRNTPDETGTDFAMAFTYTLPDGLGPVDGITRVYGNKKTRSQVFANEQSSEGRITVHVNHAQKTVRGEFSCMRMWRYPHADRPRPDEKGPISITGTFYLPYVQD